MPESKATNDFRPDYEKEYYKLIELVKHLENENAELKETIIGFCKSAFIKKGC